MAGFEAISAKLKTGTDFITGKSGALTNLFDSVKKIVPDSGYTASKPVKTSDGTVEIKAGEKIKKASKDVKSSGGFIEKIMDKKVFVPVLIIAGIYFGFRKLTKVK